jgi:type IV secretory pathway VirB10-like protein
MSAPGPFAQPPLPPVRRLSRAVWIALALLACITVFVVLFLRAPRRSAGATAQAPRPLAGSDPGFLQHPAAEPSANTAAATAATPANAAIPANAEQAYLRALLAHPPPPGATPGEPAPSFAAPPPWRPPAPPSDSRREAFARALTAPLSRSAATPAMESATGASALPPLPPLPPVPPVPPIPPLQSPAPSAPTPAAPPIAPFAPSASIAPATPGASFAPAASAAPAARAAASTAAVRFHPRLRATTLPAGTLIPALLLTEVSSDLPGNLLAQVSRDVYDFRQETVLIPSGTRLLGRYDSQVALGQSRLLVAWTRVVLPDGSGFDLPGLPGTGAGGAAGLAGSVDRHVLRAFGDALLLSLLSAGAQLSQPQPTGLAAAPSAGNVAAAALGQELSAAGIELLRRDISIQPTLRLPAATAFLVFVNGDLDLAPIFAGGGPDAHR